MPRPRTSAISQADLERVGRWRFGRDWKAPMANALSIGRETVVSWMRPPSDPSHRGVAPGHRADLADIVEAHAREGLRLAAELRSTVALLHGLTRLELSYIGHSSPPEALLDPEWLRAYASPAEALAGIVGRELASGRDRMDDGEADRLITALGRLTDAQALEVVDAARDVDDLTRSIPED